MTARIIVTGGRNFEDTAHAFAALNEVNSFMPIAYLAEGGAFGADMKARRWREQNGIDGKTFKAKWENACRDTCKAGHRRNQGFGKTICPAAGVYRNHDMYEEVRPDLVVAFPGGNGTRDMIQYAVKNGTLVIEFQHTTTRSLPHVIHQPGDTDSAHLLAGF